MTATESLCRFRALGTTRPPQAGKEKRVLCHLYAVNISTGCSSPATEPSSPRRWEHQGHEACGVRLQVLRCHPVFVPRQASSFQRPCHRENPSGNTPHLGGMNDPEEEQNPVKVRSSSQVSPLLGPEAWTSAVLGAPPDLLMFYRGCCQESKNPSFHLPSGPGKEERNRDPLA